MSKFLAGLRHAFSTASPHGPLSEADRELLRRLALAIVVRRMSTPALLFLQSVRPLSYLGSQAMTFLRPFLTPLFHRADYDRVASILERREGIGALIQAIEAALASEKDKAE